MDIPNIGSGLGSDWSDTTADAVAATDKVSGAPAAAQGPAAQAAENNTAAAASLAAPKKAEASLDASAMKATVEAIPINQPAFQKRDYAAEAKANWEATTSPRQKMEAANNPTPPLKPFVGDHEKAVQEAAGVFDGVPGAELGRHIAEFVTGSDASGNKIDRSEKSREICRDILKEAASHVTGEAVGEFEGEALGQVAGKAGHIGGAVIGEVAGHAVGEATGEAAKHIAGDRE